MQVASPRPTQGGGGGNRGAPSGQRAPASGLLSEDPVLKGLDLLVAEDPLIAQLAELRDQGILSDEEFETLKDRILAQQT